MLCTNSLFRVVSKHFFYQVYAIIRAVAQPFANTSAPDWLEVELHMLGEFLELCEHPLWWCAHNLVYSLYLVFFVFAGKQR